MRKVLATAAAVIVGVWVTTAHGLPRRGLPIPDILEPAQPLPWEAPSALQNGVGPRGGGYRGFYAPGGASNRKVRADEAAACVQDAECNDALSSYCDTCADGSTACAHFECAEEECLVVVCPQ